MSEQPKDPPSPLGDWRLKDATHAGCLRLSNGAELLLAVSPTGWAIVGRVGGQEHAIALTHEAIYALRCALAAHPAACPVIPVSLPALDVPGLPAKTEGLTA